MKIYIETLGCPKNDADSSVLKGFLATDSLYFEIVSDPETADVVIINTCAFILDSKEESIDAILDFSLNWKRANNGRKIIVTGCLAQRNFQELAEEIPEIDMLIGLDSTENIFNSVKSFLTGHSDRALHKVSQPFPLYSEGKHFPDTLPYSYVKIGDGCDRNCSFCSIPNFKGKHLSRKVSEIIIEIKELIKSGKKEIILVDQDLTQFSSEGYLLHDLLREIDLIPGEFWVRILYLHPDHFSEELLNTVKNSKKILHYFDIPIQHASDKILGLMNRYKNSKELEELFNRVKEEIPDAVLRTTVMVGFPGEEEEDFAMLERFIKKIEFDKLGGFVYSPEDDTQAKDLDQIKVSGKTGNKRLEIIMNIQKEVYQKKLNSLIGKTFKVLIEESEEDYYFGRIWQDAPEIDSLTYLYPKKTIKQGIFHDCKITGFSEYDLEGELI